MQKVVKHIYKFKFFMIKAHTQFSHHPAGTVISIDCDLYRHVGMLAEYNAQGERQVFAFSAKANGFLEHSIEQFSEGKTVRIDGYFGQLPSHQVMERALQWKGRPYSLFERNCEHFVRFAHNLAPTSPQLVHAGIALLAWFLLRSAKTA